MRRFVSIAPAFILLLAVAAATFAVPRLAGQAVHADQRARITLAQQTLDDDDILIRLDRAYQAVSDAVLPSVVHIEVRGGTSGSSGSGWVWDDQGHIITNAHVVSSARTIRVQFENGRYEQAELVGFDEFTDIAVIKINRGSGVLPARRATDSLIRQGQQVFAFGSPFGFKFSMSKGIVSALGREPQTAVDVNGYTNFIQTDAAVNPGNSGGPLADIYGRVVGMNVAIATGRDSSGTTEGQSAGISFAIPLQTIESVVPQLIDTGIVRRGFLGISVNTRGDQTRMIDSAVFTGRGVVINGVTTDGAAYRAGIQPDDVIIEIEGMPTPSFGVMRSVIAALNPGNPVKIKVYRSGAIVPLSVQLGELPISELAGPAIRDSLIRELGLNIGDMLGGGVGLEVRQPSVAHARGFRNGQRVRSVNGDEVRAANDVYIMLYEAGYLTGKPVTIIVEESVEDGIRRQEITLRRTR